MCAQCQTPTKRGAHLYCSRECADNAKRDLALSLPKLMPTGTCPVCQRQTKRPAIYCSQACYATTLRKERGPCPQCGKPRTSGNVFCSKACSIAAQKAPERFCERPGCFNPIHIKASHYCSSACSSFVRRAVELVEYPAEMVAKIRELRAQGFLNTDLEQMFGITVHQLKRLYSKYNIAFNKSAYSARARPPKKVKRSRKKPGAVMGRPRKHPEPPPKPAKSAPPASQPVHIPLREVYRLGGELGLPRSKRGDINAVSNAWKKANPGHPGFALGTYHPSRTQLYVHT